jgi:hypothetical protein
MLFARVWALLKKISDLNKLIGSTLPHFQWYKGRPLASIDLRNWEPYPQPWIGVWLQLVGKDVILCTAFENFVSAQVVKKINISFHEENVCSRCKISQWRYVKKVYIIALAELQPPASKQIQCHKITHQWKFQIMLQNKTIGDTIRYICNW